MSFFFCFFSFWKGKQAIDEPLFFPLLATVNKAAVNIYGGHMWKFSRYIWKGAIAGVLLLVFRFSVVSGSAKILSIWLRSFPLHPTSPHNG